jgi:hypothetical protein
MTVVVTVRGDWRPASAQATISLTSVPGSGISISGSNRVAPVFTPSAHTSLALTSIKFALLAARQRHNGLFCHLARRIKFCHQNGVGRPVFETREHVLGSVTEKAGGLCGGAAHVVGDKEIVEFGALIDVPQVVEFVGFRAGSHFGVGLFGRGSGSQRTG